MAKSVKALVDLYALKSDLSDCYVKQLHYSVNRFKKYLGRKPTKKDLKFRTVNEWLRFEQESGHLGDKSRSNLRRSIISIWKSIKPRLKTDKIRKVKVVAKNPCAWSYEEFESVVNSASGLRGILPNGVPRHLYFTTILWFGYETGLRRKDIWDFDISQFDENNRAALTQHKVSRVHIVQVTKKTRDDLFLISDIISENSDDDPNCPLRWPGSESQFYYWFKKCRSASGIDANVVNRALQHIRRTGATAVELNGGKAWQFLGHAAPGLDRVSYVDGVKTIKAMIPPINRDTINLELVDQVLEDLHVREVDPYEDQNIQIVLDEVSIGVGSCLSDPVDQKYFESNESYDYGKRSKPR